MTRNLTGIWRLWTPEPPDASGISGDTHRTCSGRTLQQHGSVGACWALDAVYNDEQYMEKLRVVTRSHYQFLIRCVEVEAAEEDGVKFFQSSFQKGEMILMLHSVSGTYVGVNLAPGFISRSYRKTMEGLVRSFLVKLETASTG